LVTSFNKPFFLIVETKIPKHAKNSIKADLDGDISGFFIIIEMEAAGYFVDGKGKLDKKDDKKSE